MAMEDLATLVVHMHARGDHVSVAHPVCVVPHPDMQLLAYGLKRFAPFVILLGTPWLCKQEQALDSSARHTHQLTRPSGSMPAVAYHFPFVQG